MKMLLNILIFRISNFCFSKSFTSMEKDFLHLANIEEENQHLNIERCIICQKEKTCRLTSTAGGREKIIKAAEFCKNDAFDHLHSRGLDKDFPYHVDNECYKGYTMTKSLKSVKRKNENENIQNNADENKEETMELDRKRTR